MAIQTNFLSAVVSFDNRQPLNDDIANQIILALNNSDLTGNLGLDCLACSVEPLVLASMSAPSAGTNQVSIELISPYGTTDEVLISAFTAAILSLNLWTSPYLSVVSVAVTA